MTCDHEDVFMSLYYINNPLFEVYDVSAGNQYNKTVLIEETKKRKEKHIKCRI